MAGEYLEIGDVVKDSPNGPATRRAIVRAAAEIGKQIKGDQHGAE